MIGWFVSESAGVCLKTNGKKLQYFTLKVQKKLSASFQNWTIHCYMICAFFIQHMQSSMYVYTAVLKDLQAHFMPIMYRLKAYMLHSIPNRSHNILL